ncbi:hypothetical protein EDB83DRAFT_2319162 [Lactarius deliciosus]|nr:hypothetical protein EDB83DRAFT_2319162 [Lactarius deliciosus]
MLGTVVLTAITLEAIAFVVVARAAIMLAAAVLAAVVLRLAAVTLVVNGLAAVAVAVVTFAAAVLTPVVLAAGTEASVMLAAVTLVALVHFWRSRYSKTPRNPFSASCTFVFLHRYDVFTPTAQKSLARQKGHDLTQSCQDPLIHFLNSGFKIESLTEACKFGIKVLSA